MDICWIDMKTLNCKSAVDFEYGLLVQGAEENFSSIEDYVLFKFFTTRLDCNVWMFCNIFGLVFFRKKNYPNMCWIFVDITNTIGTFSTSDPILGWVFQRGTWKYGDYLFVSYYTVLTSKERRGMSFYCRQPLVCERAICLAVLSNYESKNACEETLYYSKRKLFVSWLRGIDRKVLLCFAKSNEMEICMMIYNGWYSLSVAVWVH